MAIRTIRDGFVGTRTITSQIVPGCRLDADSRHAA
jgi:hypothetical protein